MVRSVAASVTQARLDAIARPSGVYYHSLAKWAVRLMKESSLTLKAWQEETGAEIAALKREENHPPPDWTGADWLALHEKRRRLQGAYDAMALILDSRAKQERTGSLSPTAFSATGRERSSATPAPASSSICPDPFADS